MPAGKRGDAPVVVLAGGSGDLGHRIADALVGEGARIRALVRGSTAPDAVERLRSIGAEPVVVALGDVPAVRDACRGAVCVVSALSGLRDVIAVAQADLLTAAISAGVPRFVPSDFAADFFRLRPGTNRNFDLRRLFHATLDTAAIRGTSILNGGFADLLTDRAPIVVHRIRRIVHWGDALQPLDFTTMDDTARYTAKAALDPDSPRVLRIAGDVVTPADLARTMSELTGDHWTTLRLGSTQRLASLVGVTRRLAPGEGVYPPWQGMQYMHNMMSGDAKLSPLDNDRYPMRWTSVRDVLEADLARRAA